MFFGLAQKLTLENIKKFVVGSNRKVPLIDGSLTQYINLDNAASTPPLKPVVDKVNELLEWYSSVHRGTGFKSQVSTQIYEEAHHIIGSFVGADLGRNTVILGKNTTEAVNKLANRLQFDKDDIVLTTFMEHHSNDLPWRFRAKVEYVALDRQGILQVDDLERKLRFYGKKVKLLAVTGASNVTGHINDIHALAQIAHKYGTKIFVDAAQLAPHRKINIMPDDDPRHIDYLVFSAHKMYAPFGTGVLIGPKKTFEEGDPDYVGGGTVDVVTRDSVHWTALPDREEAGSPNVVGAVALAKAMKIMQGLGMENIAAQEGKLTEYTLNRMRKIRNVFIYGKNEPDEATRLGVISFNIEGVPHGLVAAILSYEGGIGVRNGCFCARPYVYHLLGLDDAQIKAFQSMVLANDRSSLPGCVRVSFGMYNDQSDVDKFLELLQKIADRRNHARYRRKYDLDRSDGAYYPKGFQVNLNRYFCLD